MVDALDPAVERAILRCLEHDPRNRPPSALSVAAALPGGDPLAAALAAGETPPPEVVAAAGEQGGLNPMAGLGALVAIILGLLGIVFLSDGSHLVRSIPMPKPPDALVVDAREIVEDTGYGDPPTDIAYGFSRDEDYVLHVLRDPSSSRWEKIGTVKPPPVFFWYRQSPRYLVPKSLGGVLSYEDPPVLISGMVNVRLDPAGRLLEFLAVPPEREEEPAADVEPEWSALFAKAGLDQAEYAPEQPRWNPPINCGDRVAWRGTYAGQPDVPIRVEACGYGGKPASFRVITPWTRPARMQAVDRGRGVYLALGIGMTVCLLIIGAGIFLAWRSLKMGRGDRRGAFRLALFVFVMSVLASSLGQHHVPSFSEVFLVVQTVSISLLNAGLVWLLYIGLEPYVRRFWPDTLISWNRLLVGRWRDPLVGRDILVAGLAGLVCSMANLVWSMSFGWLGFPGSVPLSAPEVPLLGGAQVVGLLLSLVISSVFYPMSLLFIVFLLRVIFRRNWIAVGVALLLLGGLGTLGHLNIYVVGETSALSLSTYIFAGLVALWAPFLYVTIRFGILASIFYGFFWALHLVYPWTFDLSAWYARPTFFVVLMAAALAIFGFTTSRAGRPLVREELLSQ